MITVELRGNWDLLKQVPGRLDDFVRRAPKLAAQEYATATHNWINAGRAFHKGTGLLQAGTDWRPEGNDGIVYSQQRYSEFVEFGTGKYIGHRGWKIVPKPGSGRKALKFPSPGGGFQYRKSVFHPGSRPFPFFFADFDHRVDLITESLLNEFAEVIFK